MYKELKCEALIEIGPWKGSITTLISHISENFFVIEKDSTFIENWKLKIENWKFILGDVLEVDVEKMLESGIGNQESGKKNRHEENIGCVKSSLLYYVAYFKKILLKLRTRLCGRNFYASRWGRSEDAFRCKEKIIFTVAYQLCLSSYVFKMSPSEVLQTSAESKKLLSGIENWKLKIENSTRQVCRVFGYVCAV